MKTYAERFLLAHADRNSAAVDMATAAEMMQAVRASAWGVSDDLWTMLDKASAAYRDADQRLVEIAGSIGNDPRYDDWTTASEEDGFPVSATVARDDSPLPAALAVDVMQAARRGADDV